MPGPLQAAFRKRLRKAHGGPYLSIKDEPPARPTTPRLDTKPKPPVKKHDTPKSKHREHMRGGRPDPIEQAKRDWLSERAYVDGQGNYHIKTEGGVSGPIAPWNKEAKRHFKDVMELHYAALGKPIPTAIRKHDTPKSPHKEHDPRYRQGAGAAVHAGKIHHELAAIFKGKNEGAGFMTNAPRPGFNVNIAGNRADIGKRFQQLEDVDGVWEGQREKAWMANFPQQSNPRQVLQAAAAAGLANDQDAVFIRNDGPTSPGAKWDRGIALVLQTPQGIIDMVNPSKKNLEAAAKMAKRFGGGQYTAKTVWTRLLEKGKHY